MKMKSSMFKITIYKALMAAIMLLGCNSFGQLSNNVPSDMQNFPGELIDSKNIGTTFQQTFVSPKEWRAYKQEVRQKIRSNEDRISDLKIKMRHSGNGMDVLYQARIESLEKQNNKLKNRIAKYKRNRSDWASFKREVDREMDDLGQAIKDFSIDSKK
jgi:hypothetical protein